MMGWTNGKHIFGFCWKGGNAIDGDKQFSLITDQQTMLNDLTQELFYM